MSCEMKGHEKLIFLEEFSYKPFDKLGKEVRRIANVIWEVLIEATDLCRCKEEGLLLFRIIKSIIKVFKYKANMVYETKMKSRRAWVIEFSYSGNYSTDYLETGLRQTLNGQKIDLNELMEDEDEDGTTLLCKKYHCIADRMLHGEFTLFLKQREIKGIDGSTWFECEQNYIDPTLKNTHDKTHPDIETNPALEDVIEEHYPEAKVWYDLNCVVQSASCTRIVRIFTRCVQNHPSIQPYKYMSRHHGII